MSERKALLILHGKQALNEEVRAAVESKREKGWELAVRVTWEAGDAQRLVDEALAAGYSRIIAGGGDGTVRDIAEAMAAQSKQASLVLMPLGTANDFARAAGGLPLAHGRRALRAAVRRRQCDRIDRVPGRGFPGHGGFRH